jgi:hypothetical protein
MAGAHYAVNPKTGERWMLLDGKWVPAAPSKTAQSTTAGTPTEDMGKSLTYAKLMSVAEQQYGKAVDEGYNPGGPINSFARAIEDKPLIGGLAPLIRDDRADRGRAAERAFQDAQLKAMTGAGQNMQEGRDAPRTYFPGFGEGPNVAAQKRDVRKAAFEGAMGRAGPLAAHVSNPYAAKKPAAAPAKSGGVIRYDANGNRIR